LWAECLGLTFIDDYYALALAKKKKQFRVSTDPIFTAPQRRPQAVPEGEEHSSRKGTAQTSRPITRHSPASLKDTSSYYYIHYCYI
jgi:hypothetical protein